MTIDCHYMLRSGDRLIDWIDLYEAKDYVITEDVFVESRSIMLRVGLFCLGVTRGVLIGVKSTHYSCLKTNYYRNSALLSFWTLCVVRYSKKKNKVSKTVSVFILRWKGWKHILPGICQKALTSVTGPFTVSPGEGNRSCFQNVFFFRILDNGQSIKLSNPEC
jgi:hypothetical protein